MVAVEHDYAREAPTPGYPEGGPLRVVRGVGSPGRRSYPGAGLLGTFLAATVVFGLVLVNIFLAQASFGLADLQAKVAVAESQQRSLRSEVAQAESPERIAELADRLGLVPPESLRDLGR